MKKLFLSTLLLALPLLASAWDIAVENADGVTIYYNYYNNGTELEVTSSSTSSSSSGYSGVVNIPEEVTYMSRTRKVTSIGSDAFYGCRGLTSVTIPNSVTSIDNSAFLGCGGLTSVHITDIAAWCKITFRDSFSNPLSYAHHIFLNGEEIKDLVIPNSVTSIGDYAFHHCSGLTSVTIPNSATSIGVYAFSGCSGLSSVTIPNSVTSIGKSAFSGCSGLTSVTIGNSVTSIGDDAFSYCTGLTSVTIPNSVTSIGNSAFSYCTGLTSVTIPNSVTSIGGFAFTGCSGLTSVTIGNSVTSIGKDAFRYCNSLASVISKMENPCSINIDCFNKDVFYYATLYVPQGTTDKYKAKNYWNKFVYTEESDPTDIIQVSSDDLLISAQNGTITIRGEQDGLPLTVYSADGKLLGSATTKDGQASISTNLQRGEIAIVKVGSKSVKIKM